MNDKENAASRPAHASDLRREAERRVRDSSATPVEDMAEVDVGAMLHELQVHQIELEMQNEELLRAQTALQEVSDKYHDLFDFAPVGYFLLDVEGRILEVNLAGAAQLGLDRNAVIQKRFGQFLAAENRPAFAEFCLRVLATDTKQTCEVKLQRNRSLVWVLVEGIAAQGRQGPPRLCRAAVIDITQQKRAEELAAANQALQSEIVGRKLAEASLRESERRERERAEELSVLFDVVPIPVFIVHDSDSIHITGNRAADELLRNPRGSEASLSAPAEAKPRHFRAFKDGRELRLDELPAQRAAHGAHVRDFEFDLVFNDGTTHNVLGYGTPLNDAEGRPRGAVHVLIDITDRKAAEEALRQSREDLDRAQAVGQIGWWRLDTRKNVLTWSAENHRIFGVPQGTPMSYDFFLSIVHPEDRQYADTQWQAGLRGAPYDIEHRIVADGKVKWVREKAYLEFDREGQVLGGFGITQDITARKEAEEALQISEKKYRNLFENMAEEVHFWQLVRDEAGNIKTWRLVDANPPALKTWGRQSVEEARGKSTDEMFGPGATEHYLPIVEKIMSEGVSHTFEDYFPNLDKYFRFTSVPFGEFFITTGADITSIKKAELALRESEARFRALAEAIPEIVWTADAQGRVEWFNRRWYEYTGLPDSVGEGWSWEQVAHADDMPRTLKAWQEARNSGGLFQNEIRVRRHDGQFRWFLVRAWPLRDSAGQVVRWFGTNTDVQDMKQAEESLATSLAEKEVLLKEIHHRVKNNMQVISSLFGLQADQLRDEASRAVLQDVTHRVRSMALVHEKLYRSADMARVEFAEYAESLLHYLWRAHGDAASCIRLALDLEPVQLSVDAAVPCGLILNELATNALKHAFRGRGHGSEAVVQGEVAVSLRGGPEGLVCLSVRDNGAGLPEGFDWRKAGSLGLRLVQILAEQLHATVEVSSVEETRFSVSFRVPV